MRKSLTLLVLSLWIVFSLQAQVEDSIDLLDCHLQLDLSQGKPFAGRVDYQLVKLSPCHNMKLRLRGTADTVWVDGQPTATADLSAIPLSTIAVGDTCTVSVAYRGSGYVESYGWGGFHFDSKMTYNLGVCFSEDPHVMGRAVMPSRENFHDKCTYTIDLYSKPGWTARCSGERINSTLLSDGREHSTWRVSQPVSVYLIGISQADYNHITYDIPSLYSTIPLWLSYTTQQEASVRAAFAELYQVVPHFERCLGPYRFGYIGYIPTQQGSMEHVNNIALARVLMNSTSEDAQMTIAHELGHAWFGNLITCSTEADMWINEGGASFCSELAMEATSGRAAATQYYQRTLDEVLRTAHLTDGSYRPLSPMPSSHTYGSTTYKKGALVWHSLRGYLGDSLFYSALQTLMERKAFSNVSATDARDSLSLYSGANLSDFFQFHIFTAGFADHHVSLTTDRQGLRVRTSGVGTSQTPRSVRLPVSLFCADGSEHHLLLQFSSQDTTFNIASYGEVLYCVADPYCVLSDAATLLHLTLQKDTIHYDQPTHFAVQLAAPLQQSAEFYVEHHWGLPDGTTSLQGISRTANRYWLVRGDDAWGNDVQGRFYFSTSTSNSAANGYLDRGFLDRASSTDSLVLLFRSNAAEPWQCISHRREGGTTDGYLIAPHLHAGEYTLAIGDTSLLAFHEPDPSPAANLFPNPLRRGENLTISLASETPFTISILDARGAVCFRKYQAISHQPIPLTLPAGTYLVLIENKYVSLQSKLIVL